MAMLVFLWATLTYPRPTQSYWVMMIAIIQVTVAIKYFSQFKAIWWKPKHPYIEFFGLEKQNNFAVYELILLMIVFFHRAVLKNFGLWTETEKYEFQDGNFQVVKCDSMTSKIIHEELNGEKLPVIDELEVKTNADVTKSSDELIVEQEHASHKVIFRHQLVTDYPNDQPKIKAVYKDQDELIQAVEEVYQDKDGTQVVDLHQDDIQLELRLIDSLDSAQLYPASQLVVVETAVEEPLDFLPSSMILSFKEHFFIAKSLRDLMRTKRPFERKRVDVYKYMFFCELLNFLVLLFGFMEFFVSLKYLL